MNRPTRTTKKEVRVEDLKRRSDEPSSPSPKQLLRELKKMRGLSQRELERTKDEVRRWSEHLSRFFVQAGREIARIRRKHMGAE